MPLENDLDKVLIIGSGPSLVGSVAEMDIMAKAAIDALTEDGIEVVLVNPNPATVSTDKRPGVTVYLEPMTLDFLKRILRMEEPDAIITAYGSTTGLKVAHKLINDGILNQMGIKILTVTPQLLSLANQQNRADFLTDLNIKVANSWQASSVAGDLAAHLDYIQENLPFPVLVTKFNRFVHNDHIGFKDFDSLQNYFKKESQNDSFSWEHYRLDEDLSNWEEIIVNVIRDKEGNLVFPNIAGSIEPVGINSGDSTVIMPALTLNNDQVQKLRHISKKIVYELDLIGILSIHFAVKHHATNIETKVLSIKPRLTRSSVWIQRAGLYSMGYIVAKIAIGYDFSEITDPASGLNSSIEPTLDTVAIKMPFWSLSESGENHYQLGKRMQASGEAMGIGRNFETAFFKALASTIDLNLAWNFATKEYQKDNQELLHELAEQDELHLIRLLVAIAKGISFSDLQKIIDIHPVYYQKFLNIVTIAKRIAKEDLTIDLLKLAKKRGFPNLLIAKLSDQSKKAIQEKLKDANLTPSYIQIDGAAGLYPPNVHAYYSAYGVSDEVEPLEADKKVLIVGMLPLQVSVTSEFDYMLAHAAETLHNLGYATIILSNNNESVSAASEYADRLYFDPITIDNILKVAKKEKISDVLLQFSGKKVSALGNQIREAGLNLLGNFDDIKPAIKKLLKNPIAGLKNVPGITTTSIDDVIQFAEAHEFPLLIGGVSQDIKQKSAVVYDMPAVDKYLTENKLDQITISNFIEGNKYEITAISDGKRVTIPGIIEHLEQTGSHASDSIAVFKPQNLSQEAEQKITDLSIKVIKELKARGIFNLHLLEVDNSIYLLQIKPYAGHNVAFLSKSLGKPIAKCATEVIAGKNLDELGFEEGLWPANDLIHVKMPVFSYLNYSSYNTFDSKMKSSGSVMGRDTQLAKALYKGYEASNLHIPSYGTIFISVRDEDKQKICALASRFDRLGFKIVATEGTANILAESGITTGVVDKVQDNPDNILNKIRQHKIVMVVNITNLSDSASSAATVIRDQALYTHIPVFSSIETTELILDVLESLALTTQPI